MLEVGQRQGATTLSVIRQAFTDAVLGNTNASAERRRIVPAGSYVYGIIVGFQPLMAGPLLADAEAGTPQRFVWLAADDPTAPDIAPEWPTELVIPVLGDHDLEPYRVAAADGFRVAEVVVPDEIRAEVVATRRAAMRREAVPSLMDEHAQLVQLKTAALFALLEGRMEIDLDDWLLADTLVDTSRKVRTYVQEALRAAEASREAAHVRKLVSRDAATDEAAGERALESAVGSIARKVAKDGRAGRSTLTRAIAGKHRQLVTIEQVIHQAEAEGLIVADGDEWIPASRRRAS
jgi:hypothetical protein